MNRSTTANSICLTVALILTATFSFSQNWQLGGNNDAPGATGLLTNSNFFGAKQTADLRLGTGNISRMFMGGTGYANPGFVGIGNNFLTPVNLLHLRALGNANVNGNLFRTDGIINTGYENQWRMYTGTIVGAVTEKFSLFTYRSGLYTNLANSELDFGLRASERHMFFQTATVAGSPATRMWINGGKTQTINGFAGVNTTGFVGIGDHLGANSTLNPNSGAYTGPQALLHLEGPNNTIFTGSGYRNWFGTGVYSKENSDGMYVGLKTIAATPNRSDAVIAWMDDPAGGGPDQLKFIFLAPRPPFGSGLMSSVDGMEVARFSPNGFHGFGNYAALGGNLSPVRMVEILGADPNSGNNSNTPQLRTTYTYNANPLNGVFTEFQTTSLGDMYFNTRANTNVRNFGFHTSTPGNTVEINSPAASAFPGASGLRFTDMNSSSTVIPNPGSGVLSVNTSGDVIYVPNNQLNGINGITGGPAYGSPFVQLGAPCTGATTAEINGATLFNSRQIILANNNILFETGVGQTGRIGIGNTACIPGNKLEINSDASCPTQSGLRFTNLPSTSATVANPGQGILSVNASGDVIYVKDAGGVGNYCSATSNPLTNNFEVPLNNNNYYFTGCGALGTNAVVVGTPCGVAPNSKFAVYQSTGYPLGGPQTNPSWAGSFLNVDFATILTGNTNFTGIQGSAINLGPAVVQANRRVGVSGFARQGKYSYGIMASAQTNSFGYQVGGHFSVSNSTITNCAASLGIYSTVPTNTAVTSYAAYLNGSSTTGLLVLPSDSSLKKNMMTIPNAVSKIMSLKPIEFYYDTARTNALGLWLPSQKNYGFKAQDVQSNFPELVTNIMKPDDLDSAGNVIYPAFTYTGINYFGFTGILTKAIQEQQLQIDSLKNAPAGSGDVKAGTGIQNNYLTKWSNASTKELSNSLFYDDGNFTGIGTTSTGARLQIKGTGNGTFTYGLIATDNANNPLLYLHDNGQMDLNANNSNYAQQINLSTADNNSNGSFVTNTVTNASSSGNNIGYRSAVIGNFPGSQIGFRADLNNTTGSNSGTDIVINGSSSQNGSSENNGYTFSLNKGIRNRGLSGNVVNADQNIGVLVSAFYNDLSQPQSTRNYGAQFLASNASIENYGILSQSNSSMTSGTNYGIYASASGATTNYAGFFQGDVFITGSGFVNGGIPIASDQMFKTNISPLTNALAKIDQLNPKTFYYDTTNAYGLKFNGQKQSGFVAQDLITVFPEMVNTITKPAQYDSAGNVVHAAVTFKNVNYNGLHAYEIESIKELKKKIDTQDSLIQQMSNTINSCCTNANGRVASEHVTKIRGTLTDDNAFFLGQNHPNPSATITTIAYNIPDFKTSAQINFYNSNGALIKSFEIQTKGKGELELTISELANGLYTYSLVVDGSKKAELKMLKAE